MNKTKLAVPKPFEGMPKIHCPSVYGASADCPFRYKIPATGQRPMRFHAHVPEGLHLDETSGIITGAVHAPGEYPVAVTAENALGIDTAELIFLIGADAVCQTPLLGWCSWNAHQHHVSQQKVQNAASLLVQKGLSEYGYSYINIDSAWQGEYGGKWDAIQPNERFPNMKGLCDDIHALGLKCGIYSTPFLNAWGLPDAQWGLPGCTRGEPDPRFPDGQGGIGIDRCEQNNVRQWAAWGMDYLKYDWLPCDPYNADRMKRELLQSGRDFGFCVTVRAGLEHMDYWTKHCTSWRNNPDSTDSWDNIKNIFLSGKPWYPHLSAGHFYDMDMLEIGSMQDHACALTEEEQIFAVSFRAFFNSPIQISCDLAKLTDFEMALLCNDEIIAINQNIVFPGAACLSEHIEGDTHTELYRKPLSDDTYALGFFNLGETAERMSYVLDQAMCVRDSWAKEELGVAKDSLSLLLEPHTARIVTLSPADDE